MEHRFLRLFRNGVWTGNPDRSISVNGVKHNMDEYAKEHGIEVTKWTLTTPNKPKKVNTDIEEKHEDMEPAHDSRRY